MLKAQISQQPLTPTDLIIQNMQLLTAELSDPTGSFMSTLKNLQKFSGAFAESYGANKDNFTKMINDLQVVVANFKDMSYSMKSNPLLGGGWSG